MKSQISKPKSEIRNPYKPAFRISAFGFRLFFAFGLLALSGCVQIDRTLRLNVDGSGEIVEEVRFDDRLVQSAKSAPQFSRLTDFLDEKYLRERLPLYGEVTLVRHEVKDLGGRGKQSLSVLAFKDINKVTLPALPHRGSNWTDQKITFRLGAEAEYQESWLAPKSPRKPLRIDFSPATRPTPGVENSPSPVQRRELVRLLPVFRTMLDGFHVRLRLEAFGPIWREVRNRHTIYDVGADDLDDEILLKLLEWNSAPDRQLALSRAALTPLNPGGKSRIMAGGYTLQIAPPASSNPQPDKR